jgi:hypothetical protein
MSILRGANNRGSMPRLTGLPTMLHLLRKSDAVSEVLELEKTA